MRARRTPALLVAALAGSSLSGCVAIAAIPVVAGGAVARTATDDQPGPSVRVETSNDGIAASAPGAELESAGLSVFETISIENAAPGLAASTAAPMQSPEVAEFVRYSTERAFAFSQGDEAMTTAVLSEPSALDGERLECAPNDEREPAVLIDLDPGDEAFRDGSPLPDPSVALSLKVLRSEGVTIAWISENSAATADIVRDALTKSGLDPDAEDTLLLMRYPGDRKQTRRKEFAAETCLIAIAGDRRADFDELYDYLTNRNAAIELEALINNGWFLIGDRPETFSSIQNQVDEPAPDPPEADTPEPEIEDSATPDEEQEQ